MVNTLKWTTVNNLEVEKAQFRLEASVYNLAVKKSISDIEKCPFQKLDLIGFNGFFKKAHYGGRAKRNYISKSNPDSVGFLGSSEMLQVKPIPVNFLSKNGAIQQFKLKKDSVLISRSGTIGNLTFVNETLSKVLVSEHAIRLEDSEYSGFGYAFLKTETGQNLIQSKIYGAVVSQIEPEHLATIQIPNPPKYIKVSIHKKIIQSFALRDESNCLIDEAEKLLITALKLPPIDQIKEEYYHPNVDLKNFSITLNLLEDRLDGSYHIPIVMAILDILLDNSDKILPIGSCDISEKIILPGRFKRIYVDENDGAVFLGGKQIYELDPTNKKYLSVKKHGDRIAKQLFLHENMIAITCSGTIGKVNIIPKHWENWTMSQHVLRVVAKNRDIAGYLYIWLNTDYARVLIERHIYGSVVDEIDDTHLSKVPVPILKDKGLMKKINDLALRANELRSEAYYLEQDAIIQMNEGVIFARNE